ncbi:SH3 domain-containing protein [Aerolutibacter ruishenii]|uniref:Cell wall-associated NlpC family hydrolase n=1 Tax=Aerolutibacter ruishenii TaxID=686800 RepID=A0A562LW76_9GAMM|nr:SH3 domain-containing protein [Lysobacter ruishenii]TWI11880.1 cell wall-associated NlpC family hydrolase [Lysobacter ruishenii]
MTRLLPHRIAQPAIRALTLALALASLPALARGPAPTLRDNLTVPPSGVIGVEDEYLSPAFWIQRAPSPDEVLLDTAAIAARNARLLKADASMHDLAALPTALSDTQVRGWIDGLASAPTRPLWDEQDQPIAKATLDAIVANRAMDAIPARQPTRFGLAVERTALRAFPTSLRVFNTAGDGDIDRFQESALFPGDPIAIVHESADHEWLFVVSPRYAAWVAARHVAEGGRDDVLGYQARTPYRIVTGAKVHTVHTREAPRVSERQLDMGTRVPLADVPRDRPVNGQHPYASWILQLPVRDAAGRLGFSPALLQRSADSTADYLPLTRGNLLRQAFKFLGERYGWGHSYNGRDCSGFVSDVYRSMGVQLPRNTSAQAVSPVFPKTTFQLGDSREKRLDAIRALDIGDLIFIPGHVMMFAGWIDGAPYVIHDTSGGSYLGADGQLHPMHLNGVSLNPLLPLRFGKDHDYVDRMTAIVRVTRAQ